MENSESVDLRKNNLRSRYVLEAKEGDSCIGYTGTILYNVILHYTILLKLKLREKGII